MACIILASVLCLNAISQWLEATDPALAVSLNPLNADALVAVLAADLNAEMPAAADSLSGQAREIIQLAPGDARGYSLLGAIYQRTGDEAAAETLYAQALNLSKTEIYALTRTLEKSLECERFADALKQVNILLRRYPNYWQSIAPLIVQIADNDAGEAALADALAAYPPWRGRVLKELLNTPAGIEFTRTLVLDEYPSERAGLAGEATRVVNALVKQNAFDQAYQMFLSTMTPAQKAVGGYVHDAAFTLLPGQNYFGWRSQSNSSVDITFPDQSTDNAGGLRLRFLDSPAKLGTISQRLHLPPGTYDFTTTATALSLRAPKDLYWRLRCIERNGPLLGRLDYIPGTYERAAQSALIAVPNGTCPIQELSLQTDVATDSWVSRYGGSIVIHDVRIVKAGAAS